MSSTDLVNLKKLVEKMLRDNEGLKKEIAMMKQQMNEINKNNETLISMMNDLQVESVIMEKRLQDQMDYIIL